MENPERHGRLRERISGAAWFGLAGRTAIVTLALIGSACERQSVAPAATETAPTSAPELGLVIKNPVGDRPTFFDLGEVAFGQKVEHVFLIQNADPDPVTINDILPSCGCTVARIAYDGADGKEVVGQIAPGARVIILPPGIVARLSIAVDTSHVETMNRDKLTQVRVRSNSKNTPFLTLEMHIIVRRAFRSVPDRLDLGESPRSLGKGGRADITLDDRASKARILGIESIEGPFEATVDPTTINGVELWILVATPKPDLPLGPVRGKVVMSATRNDGTGVGASFSVAVSAQITNDVVLHPPLFGLKSAKPGEPLVADVELKALVPGEKVRVKSVVATGVGAEALKVEFTPDGPDGEGRSATWRLALRVAPDSQEKSFSGTVTIELDHARVPKIEANYVAGR